jgi:biotin operon repressor
MMGTPLFDNVPAQAATAIELRRATFDDDAEMTLTQGLVLVSFKRIGIAIDDTERCKRPHLRVLHLLMRNLHHATGTAFCSRRFIAEDLDLSEKTVENVLYDLRQWGYIDWQRRAAPELHPGRRLLHYVQPGLPMERR